MPAYQLSGITSVGGASPVTGTPSGYSGPWLIETQTLTLRYARVPHTMYALSGSSEDVLSLSATNTRQRAIGSTRLNFVVDAAYTRVKSYESFSTSGHLQTQKFSVLAETDKFGNTYGATSGTGIMGPAGTVITSQPYIRRVAWDDTIHTETTQAVQAANVLCFNFAINGTLDNMENPLINGNLSNWECAVGTGAEGAFQSYLDTWVLGSVGLAGYELVGPYAATQENATLFSTFLTRVGDGIRNQALAKVQPIVGTDIDGNIGNAIGFPNGPTTWLTGMPEYSSSRHDYT